MSKLNIGLRMRCVKPKINKQLVRIASGIILVFNADNIYRVSESTHINGYIIAIASFVTYMLIIRSITNFILRQLFCYNIIIGSKRLHFLVGKTNNVIETVENTRLRFDKLSKMDKILELPVGAERLQGENIFVYIENSKAVMKLIKEIGSNDDRSKSIKNK